MEAGIYPGVDVHRSWLRLLDPAFVGTDHWEMARAVLEASVHVCFRVVAASLGALVLALMIHSV